MTGDSMVLLGSVLLSVGRNGAAYLWITTSLAAALGALTWWGFFHLGNQVNTRFHMKPLHHFCCGLAAAVTTFAVFLFSGLNYAEFVTEKAVDAWAVLVRADNTWQNQVFKKAYEAVYAHKDELNIDFTGYPHPDQGGRTIPLSTPLGTSSKAIDLQSKIYAEEMVRNFKNIHPFLNKILWAQSGDGEKRVIDSMAQHFAQGNHTYELKNAVEILQKIVLENLQKKIPRVIWVSRIVLVVIFLLIQTGLGVLIVHAALADIKVLKAVRMGG